MTTCAIALDLIERRLDGVATEAEELALSSHCAGCAGCAQVLQQETAVDAELVAAFGLLEPSPQLKASILDRVRCEPTEQRWGWISDGLNAIGGLVMFALATRVLGSGDAHLGAMLIWIAGGALAVGLYPLWLGRLGGSEGEPT